MLSCKWKGRLQPCRLRFQYPAKQGRKCITNDNNREQISLFTCTECASPSPFTRPTDSSYVPFPRSLHHYYPHSYHSTPDRPNHRHCPFHTDSSVHLLTRLHDSHRDSGFVQQYTGSHHQQSCPGNMGSRHYREDRWVGAEEAEGAKRL